MKQFRPMQAPRWAILKSAFAITVLMMAQSVMAEPVAVVVNKDNGVDLNEADARELVSDIFKRDRSSWPNGEDARPVSREGATQDTLREEILGMSRSEWDSHWISKKQRSGETPPRQVGSTRMAVRLVERDPGGVTLLDETEMDRYGSNVRVLLWVGD